ncbi:MAG: Gfo/Idh/MocA family oxidoreductase [Limnochordaceae bacterium]|nr:Gfo/Idh/MocA family oxidoreductase [Limnochordaceae bacterium]
MRVGIVGLALSHPYIFAELATREGHSVAAIWDSTPGKASELVQRLSQSGAKDQRAGVTVPVAVDDPAEMLPSGKVPVEAVFVCTPSGEHARYALPFLKAGMPTFVDKALATTPEDARQLLRAGREPGRLLMSTSVIRYAPAHQALIRQVKQGVLGPTPWAEGLVAHDIQGYLDGPSTWQDSVTQGGGSIINMGIHAVEPLVAAWGSDVESVYCEAAKTVYPASQSEDTAAMVVRYRDGRLASIQVLCGSSQHGYELRVQGQKGTLQARAPSGLLQSLVGAGMGNGDPNEEYGYTATVRTFLQAVVSGQAPIPLAETATVIGILLAARKSAATGRAVHLEELALTD